MFGLSKSRSRGPGLGWHMAELNQLTCNTGFVKIFKPKQLLEGFCQNIFHGCVSLYRAHAQLRIKPLHNVMAH